MLQKEQWQGFNGRIWREEINLREFIQDNYTPYDGDASFLEAPTEATDALWGELQKLQKAEREKGGVLDMDTDIVSSLTSHKPGYISESLKEKEQIVGLQTDKPLKRAIYAIWWLSVLLRKLVQLMVIHQIQNSIRFFTDYIRHITRQYLILILLKIEESSSQ